MTPLQPAGAALESLEAAGRHVALLVAEIESLRKDAERYRWLRENSSDYRLMEKDGYGGSALFYCEELDNAIDAAISKELT